jgi:hypothetical protein
VAVGRSASRSPEISTLVVVAVVVVGVATAMTVLLVVEEVALGLAANRTMGVHVNGGSSLNRMNTKLDVETQKPSLLTVKLSWPSELMVQGDRESGLVELSWKAMYGWLKSARTYRPPDSKKPSVSK